MGLSGCMSAIEEDIPFVSRFNRDDSNLALSDEGEQGFSLFKRKDTAEQMDAEEGGAPKNPFAGLFKKQDPSEQGENVSQNQGGTKLAALFKQKRTNSGLMETEVNELAVNP